MSNGQKIFCNTYIVRTYIVFVHEIEITTSMRGCFEERKILLTCRIIISALISAAKYFSNTAHII